MGFLSDVVTILSLNKAYSWRREIIRSQGEYSVQCTFLLLICIIWVSAVTFEQRSWITAPEFPSLLFDVGRYQTDPAGQ